MELVISPDTHRDWLAHQRDLKLVVALMDGRLPRLDDETRGNAILAAGDPLGFDFPTKLRSLLFEIVGGIDGDYVLWCAETIRPGVPLDLAQRQAMQLRADGTITYDPRAGAVLVFDQASQLLDDLSMRLRHVRIEP